MKKMGILFKMFVTKDLSMWNTDRDAWQKLSDLHYIDAHHNVKNALLILS